MSFRTSAAALALGSLGLLAAGSALAQGAGYGPGMMGGYGPGMMGGYGPGGMMGGGYGGMPCWQQQGAQGNVDLGLTPEAVTGNLQRMLAIQGNDRLQVGKVAKSGDNAITAEIVTKDGSLVDKFTVDTRTGFMRRVQ